MPFIVRAQGNIGLNFGGQKEDIGYDIIQCSDGGFIIGGSTKSFGAGNTDIYLLKLSYNTNVEWIKTIGWQHKDLIRSITEVDDGYIVVGDAWDFGNSLLDIHIIKIDFDGNFIWDKQYGSSNRDNGFDIINLSDGNIAILGYSRGTDPAGDIVLLKTDLDGNQIWTKQYGTQYDDYGMEIVQDDNENIFIIGTKAGFYDDVYSTYFNVHDADVLLCCLDKDGNELWQKTYGGEGHDFGYSLSIFENSIYMCGSTQSEGNGNFDMLLLKTDELGNKLWSKTYGGSEYDYGISMTKNKEGGFYLLGTTKSFGQNQSADFYLIKVDTSGNELWNLSFGGNQTDIAYKLISTADSGVLIVGKTNSFGNGFYDVLLAKVDKSGLVQNLINGFDSTYISDIQLYPNPVTTEGRFRNLSSSELPEIFIEIVSISGSIVKSFRVVAPNYSFNAESISSGFYIYRVRKKKDSNIIFTGKLIVR